MHQGLIVFALFVGAPTVHHFDRADHECPGLSGAWLGDRSTLLVFGAPVTASRGRAPPAIASIASSMCALSSPRCGFRWLLTTSAGSLIV